MAGKMDERPEGLRERKKRQTRARIQQVALELFLSKGFEATTTEEIARAAEVSTGTLFNYFPTKETLVADDYDPLFLGLLEDRPLDEPVLTSLRLALRAGLATVMDQDKDSMVARARLARQVPALRAAAALDHARSGEVLCTIIAQRTGGEAASLSVRVAAATIVAALEAALAAWLDGDCRGDIVEMADAALDAVERGSGALLAVRPRP
ncbi:TetR family transcriptional regulator [Devosia sp. H5989]|nr:TetR family transcriptional regulator [Devosia sp. H5989]